MLVFVFTSPLSFLLEGHTAPGQGLGRPLLVQARPGPGPRSKQGFDRASLAKLGTKAKPPRPRQGLGPPRQRQWPRPQGPGLSYAVGLVERGPRGPPEDRVCLLVAPPKATAQLLSLHGHTLNILWHKTTYDQSYATVDMRSLLSILRVYSPMCSYISRARER